jgi:hypothetical protein
MLIKDNSTIRVHKTIITLGKLTCRKDYKEFEKGNLDVCVPISMVWKPKGGEMAF